MLCLLPLSGCGNSDELESGRATFPASSGSAAEPAKQRSSAVADLDVLLPSKVRIHPLTRLERAPGSPTDSNTWQIACHIELRDAFGHSTKGLGRVRVELYRPVSDRPGGPEAQDAVWNIDLRDPRENASVYDDLITRTYTVYLASLPHWLEEWATRMEERRQDDASAPGNAVGEGAILLKAYFMTYDRTGRERVFESTYRLPG